MALSKDTPTKVLGGHYIDYPMLASATIYEGGFVGSSGGYARALVAGDTFLGIAQKGCTETTAANGAEYCRTRAGVWRELRTVSSVAITDIGAAVYASDDATLTLTAGTNSPVGKIARYVTTDTAEVEFRSNDANAITLSSSNDVVLKSNDDVTITPGKAAADKVLVQAYDIDATAYVNVLTASSHATAPTLGLAAPGAITVDGSSGTADMTLTAGNDLLLKSGVAAADVVKIQAYDIDATAYQDIVTAAAHASDPTLVLHATGGIAANGALTVSNAAGTGAGAVGTVAGQNLGITAGNDLSLNAGPAAADKVTIEAYDIDATAYVALLTASSHATDPTLALAATGGITLTAATKQNGTLTLSNAAGTGAGAVAAVSGQNIGVTAGNDLTLSAGPLAADLLNLQVYDVDATAYVNIVQAAGHATIPTLALAPAGTAVGFFGATPVTQQAHVVQADTTTTGVSSAIASILLTLENFGFHATA